MVVEMMKVYTYEQNFTASQVDMISPDKTIWGIPTAALGWCLYKAISTIFRKPDSPVPQQLKSASTLRTSRARPTRIHAISQKLPAKFRPILPRGILTGLLVVVLLLVSAAVGNWLYNFYVFLRIAVTGMLGLAFMHMYRRGELFWTVVVGVIALTFNPIAPFRFSKDSWRFLNVVAALAISALVTVAKRYHTDRPDLERVGGNLTCHTCEKVDAEFISVRTKRTLAAANGRPTKALDDTELEVLTRIMSHKAEHAS